MRSTGALHCGGRLSPARFWMRQKSRIPLLVLFVASLRLLVTAQTVAAQPASSRREVPPDRIGVRMKVDSGVRLQKRQLFLLRSVALRLLFEAGVETRWVEPGTTHAARTTSLDVDVIAVRIARGTHPGRSDICGEIRPDTAALARPDVTIYASCIAGTIDRLWRWPQIGALEWGAVAGVVLAHEVAHALGVVHASKGIMQANLGVAEWQAFVAGTLAFSEKTRRSYGQRGSTAGATSRPRWSWRRSGLRDSLRRPRSRRPGCET